MKRAFKIVLVVNLVLLVSTFSLYMSNKSKQEKIASNMISIQALERQSEQVKVSEITKIGELEKKLAYSQSGVYYKLERTAHEENYTQYWFYLRDIENSKG